MTKFVAALGLLFASFAASAQTGGAQPQYVISTFAGGANPPPAAVPALQALFGWTTSVATSPGGNVYFTSSGAVYKLDRSGNVIRVAGTGASGPLGDGGPAINASINTSLLQSGGVAADAAGDLYIADTGNHRVRRVSPDGIVVTIAGTGVAGFSGDGGPAANAQLNGPADVAVDGAGNLYIADSFNLRVRKVAASGIITTIAGTGSFGSSGDGGPAVNAQMLYPVAVAVDSAGANVYIADYNDNRVRKVSNGIITTFAGTGAIGASGDGGPAIQAQLGTPTGVAVDTAGQVYISEVRYAQSVRMVAADETISTVAGGSVYGFSGDGGPATKAGVWAPLAVAVDSSGNLYIADAPALRIREVTSDGIINTIAGSGNPAAVTPSPDGVPATSVQLGYSPWSVASDSTGNVYIAESYRIRKVTPSGTISTYAGNNTSGFSGDGSPAVNAQISEPLGLTVDAAGNLFFIDGGNSRVRKVSPDGIITTVAGNGVGGYATGDIGDGGPALSATLGGFGSCNASCGGLAVDQAGNLYIADSSFNRIRKVTPDGIISTVAGPGTVGSLGDGGPAVQAQLNSPSSVVVDGGGNLLITDTGSGRIRKVLPGGTITTIAGSGDDTQTTSGDGGPAINARLSAPASLALDTAGNLFIADPGWNYFTGGDVGILACCDHRIRRVSPDGTISTVAGTGAPGFSGDGGAASTAALNAPQGVATDAAGDVYVADSGNDVIRVLRPVNDPVLIGSVINAATEIAGPVVPGMIVVIYGAGLGPPTLGSNTAANGVFSTALSGTSVAFNGTAAPMLYSSATQVAAVVPYELSGTSAQATVTYQGRASNAITVSIAQTAPSPFTANQLGWGQASAVNASDGTVNSPTNPTKIGDSVSLYVTGLGQTSPAGVDGQASSTNSQPVLPVSATVGDLSAVVQSASGAPTQVAGLMQVTVQIPSGVQPGGYVPVVLQVGDATTAPDEVWISVSER